MAKSYLYEKSTGQFRDRSTGRFVTLDVVENAIDTEVLTLQNKLGAIALDYTEGRTDIPTFQTRMAEAIKDSHLRVGAIASGGIRRLNQKHFGAIGGRLSNEYVNYLYKFGTDLSSNDYSPEYIIWRAKLYARSPRQSFNLLRKLTLTQDGEFEGWRTLSDAIHCKSCPNYVTNGWVDLNTIVAIGAKCECRGNCKCRIRVRPKISQKSKVKGQKSKV